MNYILFFIYSIYNLCYNYYHNVMKGEMKMPWLPTIDEYRKIARCHGGYYKAKNPPTTPNKLTRWICKYGHRFQLSLKQIIDEDKWCPICAENHIKIGRAHV